MKSGNWLRIIMHVDMDAFFASVEQLLHPEWKNKPVIVGADPQNGKGRGVVSAASYEARQFGIHSAMPISQAYQKCPHGIYVKPHGDVYRDFSQKIFNILKRFTPLLEPISIDEAFLDMSGCSHLYASIEQMGVKIKQEIKEETELNASIGIAPNKSLAKIASDFQKPDGLTVINPNEIQQFLDPLSVTKLWGIGKKMALDLQNMGIRTVFELRQYPENFLENKFGKMGLHIYKMARGIDDRKVIPEEQAKSVSHETTFAEDIQDYSYIQKAVFKLSEKVAGRLRRSNIEGNTIHLKIRFSDFKTYVRSHTLESPTQLTEEIFHTTDFMLTAFNPLKSPVRLVGVGISGLVNKEGTQLSFWDMDKEKKRKAEKMMDQIQDKFGRHIISHAESLSDSVNVEKKKSNAASGPELD
jgi:nucleotidyltransferase/DNA polymerase involved in DNA repair